jgi:tetratricopeptide (TPR) repeat protein
VTAWQNLAELYQNIIVIAKERTQFINLAIETLRKALVLEPGNPRFYTDIGNLYLLLGERDNARAEFEKAIAQKIYFTSAQIALALMSEDEGKIDEAINRLEPLLVRNPNDIEILFQLGRLYYNGGEVDKAITQFRTALNLNPSYSNVRFSLGIAYEKQGKVDEALKEFEAVLDSNPDNKELKDRIQRLREGVLQPEEEIQKPEEKTEGALEGIE